MYPSAGSSAKAAGQIMVLPCRSVHVLQAAHSLLQVLKQALLRKSSN